MTRTITFSRCCAASGGPAAAAISRGCARARDDMAEWVSFDVGFLEHQQADQWNPPLVGSQRRDLVAEERPSAGSRSLSEIGLPAEAASSRHLLRVRLSVGCGRLAVLGRHLPRYRAGLVLHLRVGERPRSRLQCGTFNAEHPALLRVVGMRGTSRTVTCGAVSNTACSLSSSGVATRIEWVECPATNAATVVVSRMRPRPMMTRLSAANATSLIRCELNSTARPCPARTLLHCAFPRSQGR